MTITREQLELAALAAGYEYTVHWVGGSDYTLSIGDRDFWVPHTSIADAAKLAVRTNTTVAVGRKVAVASGIKLTTPCVVEHDGTEPDKLRAWCEAVTLCAAAVGERMKEAK